MRYNRTAKTIAIIGLAIVLACITVAYAVLSQNLKISGSGRVDAASWDVHFANVQIAGNSGTASYTLPSIVEGTTLKDFKVELKSPTDSVTFTFDVVNGGDIDAIINTITQPTSSTLKCEGLSSVTGTTDGQRLCSNLQIDLTYVSDTTNGEYSGKAVTVNDKLTNGATKKMALKFSLKSTAEQDVPVDDVKISGMSFSIIYNQTT